MKTTTVTDYFAPLGRNTRFEELASNQEFLQIASLLSLTLARVTRDELSQFDTADRFTYIIMGLAVLTAIVIPLLN